jgi:hypothetical protein
LQFPPAGCTSKVAPSGVSERAVLNLRNLLRVVPACLVLWLLAMAPASAGNRLEREAGAGTFDRLAQPLKLAPHGSPTAQPELAALEEFYGIDNDAEQYFKAPARVRSAGSAFAPLAASTHGVYRAPPRSHRGCAAPPTGPPHA